jgi:hypothetical protein
MQHPPPTNPASTAPPPRDEPASRHKSQSQACIPLRETALLTTAPILRCHTRRTLERRVFQTACGLTTGVQPPCGCRSVTKLDLKCCKRNASLKRTLDSKVGCNELLCGHDARQRWLTPTAPMPILPAGHLSRRHTYPPQGMFSG